MAIPVYVLTGFLDAGKTTFLQKLLQREDSRGVSLLICQFEQGETELICPDVGCETLVFSKRMLEERPNEIANQLVAHLQAHPAEEIWVEWNGMAPFSDLQELMLTPDLAMLCQIRRVIYCAEAEMLEALLGRTGSAPLTQVAECDFILLRNATPQARRRITRRLRAWNPGVQVYEAEAGDGMEVPLFQKKMHPLSVFFLVLFALVCLYPVVVPFFGLSLPRATAVVPVFLGILLQAFPFLLIGVLLSSLIQVFLPREWIERRFPKSLGLGMVVAVLSGFFLPVCDCASIPIFRSLLKKGIPLPVGITFLAAAPVINLVVMLSTYYAFGGDWSMVAQRVGLGVVSALGIGLIFALCPSKEEDSVGTGFDGLICACGCFEDTEAARTLPQRVAILLRHAQAEFFDVGRYLVIGAFAAALIQVFAGGLFLSLQGGTGLVISLLFMMAMAFLLSLCSSSDAIIARSLANQMPAGAVMGFLLFGPIMDLKNVLMLSAGFSKRFILRLLLASFVVCFAVVLICFSLGGL